MPVAWVSRSVKCADADADLRSTPDSGFRFRWSDCCFRWDSAILLDGSGVLVSGVSVGCYWLRSNIWGILGFIRCETSDAS